MQPFLDKIAGELTQIHPIENLKDICVVLPSRRATHFFKRALAARSEKPFLSPHIFAIDDFICQLSGLQIADPISLLFDLFDVYSQEEGGIKFEDFIRWAPTVLKDFDLIDQYLVEDVDALFAYLDEAEAISRWTPEANKPIQITENTAGYFSFYQTLARVYSRFNQYLLEKEIAYRGRAYRLVAESLFDFLEEEMPYQHFYFIGLNALSKSEKSIVTQLTGSGKATCFWDTDVYFMDNDHQAGEVLRKYRKEGRFGKWNEPENLLLTDQKKIEILESPFETLQAKLASRLAADERTVFVVPDESMLQPILFSMGEQLPEYNISMGLGMAYSKMAVLWTAVIDLHTKGTVHSYKGDRFHFDAVLRILNDPRVQEYERMKYGFDQPYKAFSDRVKEGNMVYVSEGYLKEAFPKDDLIKAIFTPWAGRAGALVTCLRKVLDLLQDSVLGSSDLLEKEFFMLLLSVINRLEAEIRKYADLSLEGVKALMAELSKLERVPFRGEQVADLQIMSLLETRCLDFEHIVLFSFNEGVIPSVQKNNSLLPYDACKAFDIPVYSDQDSIMAYHFYRLLMRAKKATLIFSSAGGGGLGAKKEPSRFILQLMNQLAVENKGLKLTRQQIELDKEGPGETTAISLNKTPELLTRMKDYLENKGLSASSINMYLNCPLQFYLTKILRINEQDEVQEVFGLDVYGNWMHYSLEKISEDLLGLGKQVRPADKPKVLAAIPRILEEVFQQHFKGFEKETGLNLVYEMMARRDLQHYYEKHFFQEPVKTVLKAEYHTSAILPLQVQGEELKLKLTGNVDSVELHGDQLVLLDYKTGKINETDLKVSSRNTLTETLGQENKGKFRQIVFYKYLISRELNEKNGELSTFVKDSSSIQAGMYSFQSRENKLMPLEEGVSLDELRMELEKWLGELVSDMLDPNRPITQTEKVTNCEYCHFKELCSR